MALAPEAPSGPAPDARSLAQQAESSPVVERLARLGLLSRALVWLLIGGLTVSVALGSGGEQADQSGALRTVGSTPGGTVLLLALAFGFLAYGAYQLLVAAVGHRHDDGGERVRHRLKSLGEGVLYLAFAASSVRTAAGSSTDSDQKTQSLTADAMGLPAGRWLVGLAGAVVVVVALVLFGRALAEHHADRLDGAPARWRRPLIRLGIAGLSGRSLAVGMVGAFLAVAAVRYQPSEAKGLDASLDALSRQPYGTALLLLAAAGFACYGLWSLAEARWRDV